MGKSIAYNSLPVNTYNRTLCKTPASVVALVARKPDQAAVVRVMNLIQERLEAYGATALVVRLGLISKERPNVSGTAANWVRGSYGPSFDDLMLMLAESGSLDDEMKAAWEGTDYKPQRPPAMGRGGKGTGQRKQTGS